MMTEPTPVGDDRAWAETLVRDAASNFNRRDIAAIIRGYHRDAVLEVCSEGLREESRGLDAIERSWRTVFTLFPKMKVEKTMVAADPQGAIVNQWTGSVDGKSAAYGLDLWWVDRATRTVIRHEVISFGRVLPARSLAGSLRWMLIHPTSLARFAKALL